MDNLQLQTEIQALQKLRGHYESQLRFVGLDLCDLPDDVNATLDECVELQRQTQLHELRLEYLKEFSYIKQKERIENKLKVKEMQAGIKEQERQIDKELGECAALERFTTAVNKRLVSESEMQRNKIMVETKMQNLQERQKALNIPDDLNIDQLVAKVERLQSLKSKEKSQVV